MEHGQAVDGGGELPPAGSDKRCSGKPQRRGASPERPGSRPNVSYTLPASGVPPPKPAHARPRSVFKPDHPIERPVRQPNGLPSDLACPRGWRTVRSNGLVRALTHQRTLPACRHPLNFADPLTAPYDRFAGRDVVSLDVRVSGPSAVPKGAL